MSQRNTQADSFTTNIKDEIYCTLTEMIKTKNVTWNCHLDESSKGRYDMILDIYLLIYLGLVIKFYYHVIYADYGPLKGSTESMFDLGMYKFKYVNTGKITTKELFISTYAEEIQILEQVHTSKKL